MYTAYYNLKETPFNQSVDPKYTWLSEKQLDALAAFKQQYIDKKGLFLITGDAGTGKTAFIKRLLSEIESKIIVATVTDPDLDRLDFFNWLSVEFNLNVMFKSKGAFLARFKRFLLEACRQNTNVTLIIDDAHRINQELIEEILTLSNIENAGSKLMSIFFVGQSGFQKILQDKQNSALRQSIDTHFHLKPLKEDETVQLILYRLKAAGAKAEIFSSRAYHEIYRFSAGYPRLVVNICDRAMTAGCISATHMIDKDLIIECRKDLQIAGIEKENKGSDYLNGIYESKGYATKTTREKNEGLKKSQIGELKFKMVSLARTAILPVFLVVLVIVGIYFTYQFKSALLSWASINLDQDKSTSMEPEPAALNTAQEIEDESEINLLLPSNENEKSNQIEKKQAELPSDGYVTGERRIDEEIDSVDIQSIPAVDESFVKPTVVDDISAVEVDNESLQIKSEMETTNPSAPEKKVSEIFHEKNAAKIEELPLELADIEAEKELTEREFKMLSRRLALKLKLLEIERPEVDIEELRLEPKTGRVTGAQPANDSNARKDVKPPQLMAKELYPPEIEQKEADVQVVHLQPKTEKISDVQPADGSGTMKDAQPMQPVAKILDPLGKERLKSDTQIVRPEPEIEKIIGIQSADDSRAKIDVQLSQAAVKKKAPPQAPPVKSDLDPVAKPQQESAIEVAGLGQVDREDDIRSRLSLKEQLQAFLEVYCRTYEAKDLDQFSTFFTPDARENDKPFHDLLPKYRHNFDVIEFINYRIELQKYKYDDVQGTVNIEGRFFLEWLPGGTKWRRNSGKIFMELQQSGTSYKISRLEYYGDQPKKAR